MSDKKLYLTSDFLDFYDHMFESKYFGAEEFRRVTTEGPSRREMFEIFDRVNLSTPEHGIVSDIVPTLRSILWMSPEISPSNMLVVYTDERAHRGEGKILVDFDVAEEKYPNYYCSEFIPPRSYESGAESWRFLQIGNRAWKFHYRNRIDGLIPAVPGILRTATYPKNWQSNVGDPSISFLGEVHPISDIAYPLFAIDYLLHKIYPGATLCIDLNIAPEIRGTTIEDKLDPDQVVELITDYYRGVDTPRRSKKLVRNARQNY